MKDVFTDKENNFAENTIRAISSPSDCRFLLTGGVDRKLRFWDMSRIENSAVILGLDIDEPKPRYRYEILAKKIKTTTLLCITIITSF